MAKRTIEEVYILLNKKRENAISDRTATKNKIKIENDNISLNDLFNKFIELKGEIQAYTDVIILLETSGLIKPEDNEKDKEAFLR